MASINLLLIGLVGLGALLSLFLFPPQKRWIALLLASLTFLSILAKEKVFIILVISFLIYILAFLIEKKKIKVWQAALIVLSPLFISKLSQMGGGHFEVNSAKEIVDIETLHWSFLFQIIGLSYFTFNGLSYLIDINRKYTTPEKNFFFLLLYLIYFPAVLSGPLHRAKYLMQKFRNIEINNNSLSKGFRLILLGLFKNIVLAQRIFILFYDLSISEIGGFYYLLLGTLFFLYIYCNFSSFIDIFQGVSEILGIRLKDNFRNRVYLSNSRQNFWNGWHISLNEWFRDYFFFTLAKHDKKRNFSDLILLTTFILIAIWHEFSVALLLWGVLNGSWIIIEKRLEFKKWPWPKFRKYAGVFYHLLISSIIAIVFITPNIESFINKVFYSPNYLPLISFSRNAANMVILLVSFLIMDFYYSQAQEQRFDEYLDNKPLLTRWAIYFQLGFFIIVFGMSGGVENYYVHF